MSILEVRDLSLQAGTTPILDSIRLRIDGPGVFALLGPSGAGKSTLLRAIQRLIEPGQGNWRRSGSVTLDGENLFDPGLRREKVARRIGFIQQKPRMLAGSVRANVEFALKHTTRLPRRRVRALAEDALERVGLIPELRNPDMAAWKLSGGQAQRLAIARAMALNPRVMLMDEPSSALDPLKSQRVEEIIHDIGRDRLVVLVTHDVLLARRVANAAAFIFPMPNGARVAESGSMPAILTEPVHPLARDFVSHGGQAGRQAELGRQLSQQLQQVDRKEASGFALRPFPVFQRMFLFICGGNTSRSPMASVICRNEVAKVLGLSTEKLASHGVSIFSAGISVTESKPMSAHAVQALAQWGLNPGEHRSREVTATDLKEADAVFCMTDSQCQTLLTRFPWAKPKVQRLNPVGDIQNPHGMVLDTYVQVARTIREAIRWRMEDMQRSFKPAR